MNAQVVMTADTRHPGEAATQPAPAASLAGMRLWKDPDQPRPAKQDCFAELSGPKPLSPVATQLGWETVDPIMVPPTTVPFTVEPQVEAQIDTLAAIPAPDLMIAEGGLPPHVSPFPQRARDNRRRDSDILGYWARIRGERDMPAWTDLDQNQIAYFWPNSFLLSCISRNDRGTPMISQATRIIDNDGLADRSADIAFTPPMVSWIMRLSFDVASIAMPLIDTHVFKNEDGARMTCELVAMPLSNTGDRVDHVLCHVKPLDGQS